MFFCIEAIDADEIKSLPGWDGPLPSRMWRLLVHCVELFNYHISIHANMLVLDRSGYIKVPGDRGNKFYHYWSELATNEHV